MTQQPEAFMTTKLDGSRRRIIDAAKYDPRDARFWINAEAQAEHIVTPLMPAPLVADEMVERAAKALEKHIKQETYGWSDDDFEIWWSRDSRFIEQIHVWGWFKGTEKQKCLHEARIVLEAALS